MKRILFFAIFLYDFFSDIDEDRGTIQIAHSMCQSIINKAAKGDNYFSKMEAIASIPSLLLEFKGITENVVYAEIEDERKQTFSKLGISFDENKLGFNYRVIVGKIKKIIKKYEETITIDDLQEWKDELLETYKYMKPVCERIENIFGTKIEAKKKLHIEKAVCAAYKGLLEGNIYCIYDLLVQLQNWENIGVDLRGQTDDKCKELSIIKYDSCKNCYYLNDHLLLDKLDDVLEYQFCQLGINNADLEKYKEVLQKIDSESWNSRYQQIINTIKCMVENCMHKAIIKYADIEKIRKSAGSIIDCINRDNSYSSKMEDIASIPSLLLEFKWIIENVVYAKNKDEWKQTFGKVGISFEKNKLKFEYKVIVDKIKKIIKKYEETITINDLQKWKDKLLEAYKYMKPVCKQIENIFGTKIEEKKRQMEREEKAKEQYIQVAEIQAEAKKIISCINGDGDCSSKMRDIASIPSLLSTLSDVADGGVICANIDEKWCEDFWELGIYIEYPNNKDKSYFILRDQVSDMVIANIIQTIIETYEKSITIDDLQEWKDKLLKAYTDMKPVCKQIENIFGTKIEEKKRQMEREEKAKKRQVAVIHTEAEMLIYNIDEDDSYSSKMKAVASIPSLLLKLSDVADGGVICANIDKEWCKDFWELGIDIYPNNKDKSYFILKDQVSDSVIAETIQTIIETYEETITINDLQEWKDKLLKAYTDMKPVCKQIKNIFGTKIEAKKRQMEREEKAKEQYIQVAEIQAEAEMLIYNIDEDDSYSSKMKDIASIPSLLSRFEGIDVPGVYEEIKKEWKQTFGKLGISFDENKLRFEYKVIVEKVKKIIETYEKSITIDDLQEWKNKLLDAYKCIEPECTEMEKVFDKEIERRETENNELINHIAEKEEAMVNYLVKKENELKIRKAQEALINFNPISVVQLSFEPKYTQSIIVNPIRTLRNCYMQANPLKNMINRQIKYIFDTETPIKRILFLQDLVKLMKGSMVGNYKLNCDLDLLKNLIFGGNYYSKQHLLEEDVFKDMAIAKFDNCMAKNIKIEELPLLIRKLDELGQLLSFGDFVVSVDSLHDLIKWLQNIYKSFMIKQESFMIEQERLARKSEKHKRKLEAKEKKEKRTAIYKDAVLKNDCKKAEKRRSKMINKESIVGTEKLFIPQISADDDFVEEERLKVEEEKLEKIAKERIKARKELNCKIKESGDDKRLVIAEDEIKQLGVTKNRTMKVRQQSVVRQNTERKVPNRGNDVIESKKVSNKKFAAKTINKTNSSSNVLDKGNVIKDSKNNLRYIGMRSTNVDGKIILPEEYIKLPLSIQKEYTVYEE